MRSRSCATTAWSISDLPDHTGRFGHDGQERYDPYRHDAMPPYALGYTLADLGPRDRSTELHRGAHREPAQQKGA